jgi:hypothetical protein
MARGEVLALCGANGAGKVRACVRRRALCVTD